MQSYSKYDLTFANYLFTLYILIHIYSYIRFFKYIYIYYIIRGLYEEVKRSYERLTLISRLIEVYYSFWLLGHRKHDSTYHITQRFTTIAQLITQITEEKEEKKKAVYLLREYNISSMITTTFLLKFLLSKIIIDLFSFIRLALKKKRITHFINIISYAVGICEYYPSIAQVVLIKFTIVMIIVILIVVVTIVSVIEFSCCTNGAMPRCC